LKIALISPAWPLRGGIAASSERLAYALQAAGHEVTIYSFTLQYPAFLFPGKTQFSDDPAPEGLTIIPLLNSVNPFNWWRAGRQIARSRPDQVVVRYWMPFMGACLGTVLRMLRRQMQGQVHITALTDNIIPHEKRPGDTLLSRYFARACSDFVVMSRSVGAEIRTVLGEKHIQQLEASGRSAIRFAPHPVYDIYGDALPQSDARAHLGLSANVPVVLFFGLIRAYKGLDLLLESLAFTAPNVQVLIAGECYGDWAPYQTIIDRLSIANRLHLHLRFIPSDAVRHYFCAADLVVQPYKNATQSGISQIAYHFGKPMVVTNVGGLPEIVTDGVSGYVTAPEPRAIAAAINDYFEHNRAAAMHAQVQQERQRFTWEYLVEVVVKSAA
jgi:D-inositol-3-phosphate glycosyltransferase